MLIGKLRQSNREISILVRLGERIIHIIPCPYREISEERTQQDYAEIAAAFGIELDTKAYDNNEWNHTMMTRRDPLGD